jgi:glycerol-3-phosphate acyltransferase PlsY
MHVSGFSDITLILLVTTAAYLLGAIPLAQRISALHGVDIFSTGTRLAGSTNVRLSVGTFPAFIVLIGDTSKGVAAVVIAEKAGIGDPWLLFPISAVIIGHWKSIFSSFRGGDGLATLGGATIAAFPVFGLISVLFAVVVALGAQRLPYSSLLCLILGYAMLVWLIIIYGENWILALGIGCLCGLVLTNASNGHRLRSQYAGLNAIEEDV